ncbi:unnamed protein product [Prunus armeniaca]
MCLFGKHTFVLREILLEILEANPLLRGRFMHGYLRPILIEHWKDKDPDMKIFGPMPPGVAIKMNYIQHMKRSKYCICPKSYEQLMFSKFEFNGKLNPTFVEGAFKLPLSSIRAYLKEPISPRFIPVGSAGITRPDRAGLDLSKQPPAVRLNKELDFILTFKLKGEDLIQESGIPYTIVRPCALTEEPAGANLIFDQGDNITGKISREEVAQICVAALESPYASGKTFEVTARLMSLNCVLCAVVRHMSLKNMRKGKACYAFLMTFS